MSEKHGNIIQYMHMQILDNLGFSRHTIPLYVVIVIYLRRKLWQEADYEESWISKHGHSEKCTILVDFQAKEI